MTNSILIKSLPTDLVRRAEKQVRRAIKNRTLFELPRLKIAEVSLDDSAFITQVFRVKRAHFDRLSDHSLELFCLLFCVKAKRVSGFKRATPF